MLVNSRGGWVGLVLLLILGQSHLAGAQENPSPPSAGEARGESVETESQPEAVPAANDPQATQMMYFTRNLPAQVLANFLKGRDEFSQVTATANSDTESVVLSGPEATVREAVVMLRRIDLVGRAVTNPMPVPREPAGDPASEEEPASAAQSEPNSKTVSYPAENLSAQALAEKVRQRAASGLLPGIMAFIDNRNNGVILTGTEPELGMALQYLKQIDRAEPVATQAVETAPEVDQRPLLLPREGRSQATPPEQARRAREEPPQPEPEGPRAKIHIDLLLLVLPADQSKRQSESMGQLTGPIEQVMQRIDELTAAGEAKILNQFSLTAIEDQETMIQVGQRTPRITGAQTRATRDAARPLQSIVQTQTENVGTLARIQTQVNGQQVLLNLQFEKSFAAPVESGVTIGTDDEGEDIKTTGTITMTLSQTFQVESGHTEAMAVSTNVEGGTAQSVRYVLVVGAGL
ncbi:MAG: hypothetical protein WD045_15875 [Pirellulaceae bacterium]